MQAIYKSDSINKFYIFNGLNKNFNLVINNKKVCRQIHRHIISYADDLVITTTFKEELPIIYDNIEKALLLFGLELSNTKTSSISFYANNLYIKTKFEYLGFTFLFIPIKKIKRGGLLTRNDDITVRKHSKTGEGTFLTYPSYSNFHSIKEKFITVIDKLKRLSVIEVLNEINSIIRGFVNYFGWSNSYNRLRTLDGLLLRRFKKILIAKFRFNGVRRPIWVAKNFFICYSSYKTDYVNNKNMVRSPYGLRWHLHTRLLPSKDNLKRFKDTVFLVLPTKV